MPENRKYYPHGAVLLITTRMEEGLPLTPTHLNNYIVWGCLARARELYKVKVCHFVVMGNHLHLILVVDDPEHVPLFMCYLKSEVSHCLNRLLGRRQKTRWQEGYDSPLLLDAASVKRYIKYIYLNPTRAGLVSDIEQFPGVSSWEMFTSGNYTARHRRVSRPQLFPITPALGINEQRRLVEELKQLPATESEFILEPFAWVDTFPEMQGLDIEELKQELLSEIALAHEQIRQDYARKKKRFFGATELRRQSMLLEHVPTKYSKKMICISADKELRKQFIEMFKYLADEARKVYQQWKLGELLAKVPPGMFAPRFPVLSSALYPI